MKNKKKFDFKIFWRTVIISSIIAFCMIFGFLSASKAYENTVRIGYGVYRKAVEWNENEIRIFDFSIK